LEPRLLGPLRLVALTARDSLIEIKVSRSLRVLSYVCFGVVSRSFLITSTYKAAKLAAFLLSAAVGTL